MKRVVVLLATLVMVGATICGITSCMSPVRDRIGDEVGGAADLSSLSGEVESLSAEILGTPVLIDLSHGQLPSGYPDFARVVSDMGYTIVPLRSGPITSRVLQNYRIVVLPVPRIPLSESEVTAIQSWVLAGGSLLVLGERGTYYANASLNVLCEPFGFVFNRDILYDPTDFDNHIFWVKFHVFGSAHPTTTGLSTVWMLAACSLSIGNTRIARGIVFGDTDTASVPLAAGGVGSGSGMSMSLPGNDQPRGLGAMGGVHVAAVVSTPGRGRVVAIGDNDIFEMADGLDCDEDGIPEVFEYNNALFLQNIFRWLRSTPVSEWTWMVYCAADNDLESWANRDINELEAVGSTDKVNVVVFLDTPGSAGGFYYYVTRDENEALISSPVVLSLAEPNMGDPRTLTAFIDWTKEHFPARRYVLTLWNHGTGVVQVAGRRPPFLGVCFDDQADDYLTTAELKTALSSSKGAFIDLLAFNACLMGMVEIACQVKQFASVMVASEEAMWATGLPYDTVLRQLARTPNMPTATLARAMCDRFAEFYGKSDPVSMLSAVDLRTIDAVTVAVRRLSVVLRKHWTCCRGAIISARDQADEMMYDADYVDLVDFCKKLASLTRHSEVKNAANDVASATTRAVLKHVRATTRRTTGLSVYFPRSGYWSEYAAIDFAISRWHEFVSFYVAQNGVPLAAAPL